MWWESGLPPSRFSMVREGGFWQAELPLQNFTSSSKLSFLESFLFCLLSSTVFKKHCSICMGSLVQQWNSSIFIIGILSILALLNRWVLASTLCVQYSDNVDNVNFSCEIWLSQKRSSFISVIIFLLSSGRATLFLLCGFSACNSCDGFYLCN